jgi:Aerotolerance regulator N-terminal
MWLAPLFLLGLLGIGIPLWLHRFARQTDTEQPFASLMFLERSEVRRSRRHELRYWWLLLLRMALLCLLALAFAGPLWHVAAKSTRSAATLHVIAVDTSLSMNRAGVMNQARKQANTLLETVRGADRVMVVAADHRLRVLQEPVFAAQSGLAGAAIAALQPGFARLDYGALLAAAPAWRASPGESVVLHLITDLQQSASPMRFADLQPPPGMKVDIQDARVAASTNRRVASVRIAAREPGVVLVAIDGVDANAGTEQSRTVVIEINGVEKGRQPLRETGPAVLRFQVGEMNEGEHRLTARLLPADALPADDSFFSLVRRVQPRVLLIAASGVADDAAYLRAALQSLGNLHFQVETAAVTALTSRLLTDFSVIVISDAGILTTTAESALSKYVSAGGSVLMTLGARAAQRSLMPLTLAKLSKGRARAAGNEPTRVAELDQAHPILRDATGWRSVRFFRHVPTLVPEAAKVLMRLESGAPLLTEQSLGNGRVLTLCSPLDREWNDLAIHPVFVRFVAEAAAYLAGEHGEAMGLVGSPVEANLARGGGQVFDPNGRRVMMMGAREGPRLVPELPGFYEVRGGGRSDWIGVNTDARESDLRPLDAASLQRWQALSTPASTADAAVVAARSSQRLLPLWFWLLIAAALVAFMEPLVANYHLHLLRESRT